MHSEINSEAIETPGGKTPIQEKLHIQRVKIIKHTKPVVLERVPFMARVPHGVINSYNIMFPTDPKYNSKQNFDDNK